MRALMIFIFLTLFASTVFADDIRPQWKDICPSGLENAEYKEIQQFWPEGTKDTQEIYNYWAKRRLDFEEELVKCDFLSEELRNGCYENLKYKHNYNVEFYNDIVRNKSINNQIRKDTQRRMSNPIMINVFSR